MRLINATTMQLEYFMADPPPYAILSHTWEDDEVTFQDFTDPNRAVTSTKKGFAKIQLACQLAKQASIAYAWVDTCCIDKTSSAELTEAINSMFAWYAESAVCYVFLSDIGAADAIDPLEPTPEFAASRWFTRGWTLQELIAPKVVEFYDQEWTLRGTKGGLAKVLETITRIDGQVLRDSSVLADIPVARRMSWAATRVTTRVEDTAYCLLGIFDISMPMLYGEGKKAFIRLQEEIAKETNDLTLFAWQARDAGVQKYRGVLATSPAEFLNANSIIVGDDKRFSDEFDMTNKGLRINSWLGTGPGESTVRTLNCSLREDPTQQIGIYLTMHGASLYARSQPDKFLLQSQSELARQPNSRILQTQQMSGKADTIYISKSLTPSRSVSLDKARQYGFLFRSGYISPLFKAHMIQPLDLWDSHQRAFLAQGVVSFTGVIFFSIKDAYVRSHRISGGSFLLACGITAGKEEGEKRPWISIGSSSGNNELVKAWGAGARSINEVSDVGSRSENKSIALMDSSRKEQIIISVEMEEAVIDGVSMYCIDIKFEDLAA